MNGAHDSRNLVTGETVHLVRHPGRNWRISSYERSQADGFVLSTFQVFAENLGWEGLEFATTHEAYSFVDGKIGGRRTDHQ